MLFLLDKIDTVAKRKEKRDCKFKFSTNKN